MRITKEEVRRVAALARLKLTDTEQDELVEHFDKILTYVDKLGELDTDGVEPTAHAVEVSARQHVARRVGRARVAGRPSPYRIG